MNRFLEATQSPIGQQRRGHRYFPPSLAGSPFDVPSQQTDCFSCNSVQSTCPSVTPPPGGWRPQFGVRALLIGIGVLCAALATNANRIHRERNATERLAAKGASVSIGSSAPQWAPRWVDTHFFERPAAVTQGSRPWSLSLSDIARPLSRIEMFFIFDDLKRRKDRGTLTDDSLPDIAELDGCISRRWPRQYYR